MGDIRRNQAKLSDLHEQSKTITRSAEMHDIREKMQEEINRVSKSADAIKKRLAELDRSNEAALKKSTYKEGSSADRTRTAITGALKKKLKDLMGEFQDLRARVNAEYREVVERRVYTGT
jgi:syntaxin 1B/2/3